MSKRINKTNRKRKNYWVFYNKNRIDCYTIIFENGDMWGCSKRPEDPAGYAGNIIEVKSWDNINQYIKEARSSVKKLGVELSKDTDLPEDVLSYIDQLLKIHYGTSKNTK